MIPLPEQKAQLRKKLRVARAALPDHSLRSERACRNITRLAQWNSARNVLIYVSSRSELNTAFLLDSLLNAPQKNCVVPKCLPNGALNLIQIRSRDELAPGAYGILEPVRELSETPAHLIPPDKIDLAILPGIGFDENGNRLGQGGGYYDRLLPKLKKICPAVGLAFECQILPNISVEDHDCRVKYLVTEERIITCQKLTVWGITGGIACGKSFVSNFFRENGIPVFDADRFGHSLYKNSDIRNILTNRWGKEILASDGAIDRKKIARIVFSSETGKNDSKELDFLNRLFHPLIYQGWSEFREMARQNEKNAVILDAALLLESGWKNECDHILFIQTPREIQLDFAQKRGWSLNQLLEREKNQLPINEKRKAADFVIENPGNSQLLTNLNSFLKFLKISD
ncbi:MAG: dephospho-CoA kinase [Thermoguttaceae bacterium]|nr:dephospho-CoA kinase [Thermoguttaceae bacterium]